MNYVIIGNGGAGVRAAQTIRSRDPGGKITLIDQEPHRCYYRMMLPDYICGWKGKESIYVVAEDFYRKNNIDFLPSRQVTGIDTGKREVTLSDGRGIAYDRLLISSGARPRMPEWPGHSLAGVVTLRTLDQAEEIIGLGKRSRKAAALGGGLLGVELARAFNELGLETAYLIREDRFWPQMLDSTGSAIVERRLTEKGLQIYKEEGIEEIMGDEGKVSGVKTTQGRYIETDLLGIAVGIALNIEFLQGSGIRTDAGILVNERLQTNVEEVFAAGDVAQAFDVVHGEHRINTSWLNALRQGEIAGTNLTGGNAVLEGTIPFNLINIYGLPVVSMGLDLPSSSGYEILAGDYPQGEIYKKYILNDDLLVGATLIGDVRDARVLEKLILKRAPLGRYRDMLLKKDFKLEEIASKLL